MVSESETHSPPLKPLYTLGHSSLDFAQFAKLLKDFRVELLADVRSLPQSSRYPHFSQPGFENLLRDEGISYLFLGDELGGRPDDVDAYRPEGVVDYRARRKSYAFGTGIGRVLKELEQHSLALMCAEEDPLECHRFLMICPELVQMGITPVHIRKGSQIETQEAAEDRLLQAAGFEAIAANTLFPEKRLEALEEAYKFQAEKCAYRVSPLAIDRW